jgi:hypothetical protein
MSKRFLQALCGAVIVLGGSTQARSGEVYSNGLVNGAAASYGITGMLTVTDSFTVGSSTSLTMAQVGLWDHHTSSSAPLSLNWSIGTTPFGSDISSAVNATLKDTFKFTSAFGFDIYESTFSITGSVKPGTTYWLTLTNGIDPNGSGPFWDVTSGPSKVLLGPAGIAPDTGSNSFQLFGSTVVPEPTGLALCGFAVAAVGLRAWRKRGAS